MRLLILNPNTTAAMTETVAIAARSVARTDTHITALNPQQGPAAIQGAEDGEAALPGLYALFEREAPRHDAVIIACFDDTGLWELRRQVSMPVIGIGEAGYQCALLRGERFSVVTTLSASVPVLEANLHRYGYAARCVRVRASEVPVLALEDDRATAGQRISAEVERAFTEDGCDVVVLGCAGMAGLDGPFAGPVIDGVRAAVRLVEAVYGL